jgi:hypothetical protein
MTLHQIAHALLLIALVAVAGGHVWIAAARRSE